MRSTNANALLVTMMLSAFLMFWTQATQAALDVIEQAYELDASLIERWPLSDDGSLILRPCGTCDSVTLRVTAETAYSASGSSGRISREEFLQIKSLLRGLDDALVSVFYRPSDGIVTRLRLNAD